MKLRSSLRQHNNDKLCALLGKHLDTCSECDPTWNGSYCKTGMHLRMMLGRTDCSATYNEAGFRTQDAQPDGFSITSTVLGPRKSGKQRGITNSQRTA